MTAAALPLSDPVRSREERKARAAMVKSRSKTRQRFWRPNIDAKGNQSSDILPSLTGCTYQRKGCSPLLEALSPSHSFLRMNSNGADIARLKGKAYTHPQSFQISCRLQRTSTGYGLGDRDDWLWLAPTSLVGKSVSLDPA